MQSYFHELADALQTQLHGDEVFTCNYAGEDSDFVRFNHAQVRQAGHVTNRQLTLELIHGARHVARTLTLTGQRDIDDARLRDTLATLRAQLRDVADDPHLIYATDAASTERVATDALPAPADAVSELLTAGQERDLVGIYAAGGIFAGFANSLGQRNWQSTYSFNLDWSSYHASDKAVKNAYAGFHWDSAELRRKLDWSDEQLAALRQPPVSIKPGRYRVYLAPAALLELIETMSYGGFGYKDFRTGQSTLLRLLDGRAELSPQLTLKENTAEGVAPAFQEAGFLRPPAVTLVEGGRFGSCLISPRSAREYGVATNGASAGERPYSLDVAAGSLPGADVLGTLGTGVYVGNLWYLNYSDRNACRTTGMTRFATFWVERGQIQAPLNVMRFDETIYRAFGECLRNFTAERDFILDASTYRGRSTASARLPGAVIEDFTFTL